MPNRYEWFALKEGKFDGKKDLLAVTVNDAQKVLGFFLFKFSQMDDLDFVLNQIRHIKRRTIARYPQTLPEDTKWNILENDKLKGEHFLELIKSARDNILTMNVTDAVEKWIGTHQVKVSGKEEKQFIPKLNLESTGKIWKVHEIADESEHEEFDQSLITYGKPNLKIEQKRVFDTDDPIILNKNDLDAAIKELEVKNITKTGGLEKAGDEEKLQFTITFGLYTDDIHVNRLKNIFRGQKIIFIKKNKKETADKDGPGRKIDLEYETSGELDIKEDDPAVKDTYGKLRESDVSVAGTKRVPRKFERQKKKDGEWVEDDEFETLEDYQEQLEENWAKWHEKKMLRGVNAGTLMDNHSAIEIKNWLLELWNNQNDTLWQYFKDMGLPLELTRFGEYKITMVINKNLLTDDPAGLTSDWSFEQKQELVKKLLIEPSGETTTKVQEYNIGRTTETTRYISVPADQRTEMQTKGYNTYRNFLANFVTSRLKQLNAAISESDAVGE